MVLKSFINILCSSDPHLTNSDYFRDRIRVMLKMAAVNGMAMESPGHPHGSPVTRCTHRTGLQGEAGEGKVQGRCHTGKGTLKVHFNLCAHPRRRSA